MGLLRGFQALRLLTATLLKAPLFGNGNSELLTGNALAFGDDEVDGTANFVFAGNLESIRENDGYVGNYVLRHTAPSAFNSFTTSTLVNSAADLDYHYAFLIRRVSGSGTMDFRPRLDGSNIAASVVTGINDTEFTLYDNISGTPMSSGLGGLITFNFLASDQDDVWEIKASLKRREPVSFIATGTSSAVGNLGGDLEPAYPTTVNKDDFLLMHITTAGDATYTVPSGWTVIYDENTTDSGGTGDATTTLFYKIADGTEEGTITLVRSGTTTSSIAVISSWKNVNTTTPYEQNAVVGPDTYDLSTGTGTGIVTTAVTSTSNDALALAFFSMGDSLTIQQAPTNFTTQSYYEATSLGSDSTATCYYESVEDTGTVSADAMYWNNTSKLGASITLILLPK